ncbi:MAG: hypothetical protein AB2374_09985 [Cytobacillus gottheilii]|uniref:hypothetical protein n=1 Tax=Cytobacillus gottheilii TaxID=859144 RepID=UPI00346493EB
MSHYWNEIIKRLDLTPEGAWMVYLAGVILIPLSLLLKKHLSWKEWYTTFGVVGFLAWLGNIVFFFQLDLLDSGKPSIGSIPDTIMFAIAPACISVIYCNYYISVKSKWIVAIIFTIVALITEYLLVNVGFLKQKGWEIWYSAPFYVIMFFLFLPWHIKFIKDHKY